MPISQGNMYASARRGVDTSFKLQVLFLGRGVTGLLQKLDVLNDYLEDIHRSDVGVEVHTIVNNIHTQSNDNTNIISLDVANKEAVLEYATANNIDLIHDLEGTFTSKDRFNVKDSFAFSITDDELVTQVESYLTGRSIAWMLTEPVWNIQWIYKYAHRPGTSKKAFSLSTLGRKRSIHHSKWSLFVHLQIKSYTPNTHVNSFISICS